MSRTTSSSIILLILGSLCLFTSSQCPTFYTDANQQGNSFQLCSSGDVPSQYRNQTSSFFVPSGYSVQLFLQSGYGGKAYGPYTQGSYKMPSYFNGQLSSVLVTMTNDSRCVTFYTELNQQGASFNVCSSGDVPSQYDNRASSFIVPSGYSVMLYADSGYGGKSYGPYAQGAYNLPNGFIGQLSSVSIALNLDPSEGYYNSDCVVFYTDSNQQGTAFRLSSSGNLPSPYDDQVSSIVVPPGYAVTLYTDWDFNGPYSFYDYNRPYSEWYSGPYTQGAYNMPSGFNDLLRSVSITPPTNSSCVTFHTRLATFQVCSSGDVLSFNNNQAISFEVPVGYSVMVYADSGYNGQSIGPYSQGSYDVPINFTGQLSSVSIAQTSTSGCATFYTDSNQQGATFQLCLSGDVPNQYDNQVSSFIVPSGYSVMLYAGFGYSGQSYGPYTQGSYNVPSDFTDQLSSVSIVQVSTSSCATFYTAPNGQGTSFQMCSSGDMPSQYDDQTSSFAVPEGFSVMIYADFGYTGQSIGPYAKGSYNVPSNFTGQLSSMSIAQTSTSGCATFKTESFVGYPGSSFQLCLSGDILNQNDNPLDSLVVPDGHFVMLYAGFGYTGKATGPYFPDTHNSTVYLLRMLISHPRSMTITESRCITFYLEYNQQGDAFQMCQTGNVPSQYNDQASSFVVPSGYKVWLFPEYDSHGQQYGPYTQGAYNMPDEFNNQLSYAVVDLAFAASCVTFYTDYNQQGTAFQICDYRFYGDAPVMYNNTASSFVVPAGYFVMLFSYSYFEFEEGEAGSLGPDNIGGSYIGPYLPGMYNMPAGFNDQLSSVAFNGIKEFNCAIFFSDYSQQNTAFQLCRSGNISAQNTKSFIVPYGYIVTLYTDPNYAGQSYGPYFNGSYNVPRNSSHPPTFARILPMPISTGPPAVLDPQCATFYNDPNQQNYLFQQCKDSNVDYMLSNQISSFVVPTGYIVILYTDSDFQGQASDSYSEGSYNVPSPFRDNLKSIKVDSVSEIGEIEIVQMP